MPKHTVNPDQPGGKWRAYLAGAPRDVGAVLAAAILLACNVDVPDYDSVSGGGTGGTAAVGGYTPDPVACLPKECTVPANCCEGVQPSITTGLEADDAGCPSSVYPNNWACVEMADTGHYCEHGGCSSTAECIVPGFECLNVNEVGFCVRPCDEETPCPDLDGDGNPDTLCTGDADEAGGTFCEQSLS